MDRTEVIEQIQPLMQSTVRRIDHNAGARVAFAEDSVSLRPSRGARALPFSEEGLESFMSFMGIPIRMAKNLTPDTKTRVANELLGRKDQYALLVQDNHITGMATAQQSHAAVPAERLLRTVERAAPGIYYNRVLLQGAMARLEIGAEQQVPVARGDLIQAGAVVEFSPIGIGLPSVESFAIRLACTNGMTTNDVIQTFGYGEGDDIWQFFRRSVRAAVRSVNKIAGRFHQMIEDEIAPEDRAMVIEAMIKEARLPDKVASAVRARAIQEPPQNAWDAMNMITYASSHDLDNPQEIVRAQRSASRFASESTHAMICPSCRRRR